jgi:hypothetical protein
MMNEFPTEQSSGRASVMCCFVCLLSRQQTKQHILKAFNKIKQITYGDNGDVMKKYKIVEANDVTHNLTF